MRCTTTVIGSYIHPSCFISKKSESKHQLIASPYPCKYQSKRQRRVTNSNHESSLEQTHMLTFYIQPSHPVQTPPQPPSGPAVNSFFTGRNNFALCCRRVVLHSGILFLPCHLSQIIRSCNNDLPQLTYSSEMVGCYPAI